LKEMLAAARGDIPCDLVIKGGRVANVLSLEYEEADVAIKDGIIVGVGRGHAGYAGRAEEDASGKVLIPGMIDAHIHIESSMLSPASFAGAVLPLGTTTVFADPHEIANTCGAAGVEFMWRESLDTPLDVFYAAPSCVPASAFETPAGTADAYAMTEWIRRGWCGHLGEMMNFPGVINGDEAAWSKITATWDMVRTAHLPGVTGRDLNAYLLSGCDGDHESGSPEEALEKLRRGVWVMMREGAAEHNLRDIIKIVLDDESRHSRCMAVSDDITAEHILSNGHMDHKVRMMVGMGVRPLVALAMVTINPANYFRARDRGAIAPGRIADIAVVSSVEECRAVRVFKRGVPVAADGRTLYAAPPACARIPATPRLSVEITEDMLKIPASFDSPGTPGAPVRRIRVIAASPGVILTKHVVETPKERNGLIVSDTERDILKLAVIEKNRGSGRIATGFVRGFGLKRGAIASSVAHDAHNYICVGADDESMATALRRIADDAGGLAIADGSEVLGSLALPIAGLMSGMAPEDLARTMSRLLELSRSIGAALPQPFMTMSFLSLSVIPELRLTDQGYVDVTQNRLVSLFV
jgi:adenine deaminase